jgi:hypothetical protein
MLRLYGLDERIWKRWETTASQCKGNLTAQQITVGNPGTILRDVETLIDFVGSEGIVTKGRNANLPIDRLPELNRRVGHPLELNLKRALLRDYPNVSGIFILLRVMELLQVNGSRLIVCPSALDLWRGLNPAEQYFSLLESLLFQAHSSVLGVERTREEAQAFSTTAIFLGQLTDRWCNFDHYESASNLGPHGELPPWNLFVQQQMGLVEIRPLPLSKQERKGWGGSGWLAGGARLTPWGTAVTWALLEFWNTNCGDESELEGDELSSPWFDFEEGVFPCPAEPSAPERADEATRADQQTSAERPDESPGDGSVEAPFGMLQPVFQPYFPEWRTIYTLPAREVRSGTHTFKVTLAGWQGAGGGIWRRLLVPPDASLEELAEAILFAFKFDDDHAYDFRYRDRRGKSRVYYRPSTDEGPFASEIAVAEAELALKGEMRFTFDYGDYWQFEVRLEAVDAGPCQLRGPKVIASAGKAPAQYS